MITSIKWGLGLGSVFGMHAYIRYRNLGQAAYWFTSGAFLTGFPIFGFFMFKHTFYQISIKRFESEQSSLIDESDFKKNYIRKKLKVKDDQITDDELMKKLELVQTEIVQSNLVLDKYIQEVDFDDYNETDTQIKFE